MPEEELKLPFTGNSAHQPDVVVDRMYSYLADVRTLLDHLDGEYVGPSVVQAMRRLRRVTGYST